MTAAVATGERGGAPEGPAPSRLVLHLVFLAVLAPFVLGARWGWAHSVHGGRLYPNPDAVEYTAAAQSLAASGRYYLQVGPVEAQPRYPPGWPLLLAAALRLGLPAEELWRLATGLGVLTAWAIAALASAAAASLFGVRRLGPRLVAGLVAGLAWATSPAANLFGQLVMSDEPAVLVTLAAVAAAAGVPADPRRLRLAFAAGIAVGFLAILRPSAAALLALPLAVGLWPALRGTPRRELLRSGVAAALGAALPLATAAWILARSGFPPFPFDAYGFWVPAWFGEPPRAFDWRYALAGNPAMPIHTRPPRSHLVAGLVWLLGLRGYPGWTYPLRFWGPLAWASGALLVFRFRADPRVRALARATLCWGLASLAFFACFFVAEGRFHLPLAALAAVLLGAGAGWAATRATAGAWRALLALVLLGWLGVAVAAHLRAAPRDAGEADPNPAVRAAFAAWRGSTPEERRGGSGGFDPVRAQALGLLPCATVTSIAEWGRLGPSEHVWRLQRALGLDPAEPLPQAPVHPRAHGSWCGR